MRSVAGATPVRWARSPMVRELVSSGGCVEGGSEVHYVIVNLNRSFRKVSNFNSGHFFLRSSTMSSDISTEQVVDWTDLGREMWSFLTGREAAINYRFLDMAVEVPRDTGPEAPRATWKLNGTLQITTKDNTEGGS